MKKIVVSCAVTALLGFSVSAVAAASFTLFSNNNTGSTITYNVPATHTIEPIGPYNHYSVNLPFPSSGTTSIFYKLASDQGWLCSLNVYTYDSIKATWNSKAPFPIPSSFSNDIFLVFMGSPSRCAIEPAGPSWPWSAGRSIYGYVPGSIAYADVKYVN